MIDTLCVSGIVATTPRHVVTSEGLAITSFRLASTQRRFDKGQQQWVDFDTNWYTVVAFRQLALNTQHSLAKGDRVVANGRVKVRNWHNDDKSGTSVEIEADSIGHDLLWGASEFSRTSSSRDDDSSDDLDSEEPF